MPAYINLILVLLSSIMAHGKGAHTHYRTVSTTIDATNDLEKNKQSKIPLIIYTFIIIALISFVIFLFLNF